MKNIYLLLCALILAISSDAQNTYFYSNTVHHFETVVNGNQQWKYFVGLSEPDSNWRKLNFNDASWSSGNGGIGYGDNDDATVTANCSSLFMRKQFSITDTSKIIELLLSIDYDDGFVAYINNVEVKRKNIGVVGVIPTYNTLATAAHEAGLYRGVKAEYFFIDKETIKALVKNGTNVFCIQIHNNTTSGGDNDLSALPYLMVGLNNSSVVYGANPTWFAPPFYSHLPIVQILTNNQVIINEPKKTMWMRIISNGNKQNHMTDSATEYSGKAGVELHGASSINFPQKSYGVTTYDSMALPDNVKIFDFPKESDFILYAPWNDKTLMRNVMIYDLARKMGWYGPRCKFVEVFLDTQYVGVYVMMEKIKIDKERVAISQIKPNHNAGDSLTGGYIFKVDWNADPGLGTWNSHIVTYNGQAKSVRFQTSDPNGLDITGAQRNYIENYIDSFEQNLIGTNLTNLTTGYRKYIDVGSFIDYFILSEITHNVDAYRASTYFFKNKDSQGGKLVMGPVWDYNFSLGNASFCNSNDTSGWSGCTANNTLWWFDRLNSENYYRDQLRCRWTSLYYSLLSTENINSYVDSIAAYLYVPQLRHFTRWVILGSDLNNGHVSTAYSQEISWLKNWYRGRSTWLNLYMPGWHNPCAESPAANRLLVSELNYNSDKNLDGGNWIEFYNNSSGALNLINSVFSANGGATSRKFPNISIPSFSYLVICEDTVLFNKVYPNVKNKLGNLGFGFNNNEGRLTLYDMNSYPIFSFIYSNQWPWPQGANGAGKTLEHFGINNSYSSATDWFEGCIGGSPGRAYGRCMQDVNVTEINYTAATTHNNGDWFELKNNSNSPKNIGGYVFKDEDSSHSFVFPPNLTIQPHDYLIVCSDTTKFKSFNPTFKNRIGNFNFGISNKSDAIRLFTNTNLLYQNIYYTDTAAPWPNGANGTGYTIELKNDTLQCDVGGNWTLGCLYGSPGKRYHKVCNPGLTAKVSVSELNLNPPLYADDGGWIELHNFDTLDLDLTDFTLAHTAASDTSYVLKEGTILKKNDYVVLCNDLVKFKKWHPLITKTYALDKWKFIANGDSIVLKDFNGNSIIKMKSALNATLLTEANGLGKTLELKKDTSNLNSASSWFDGCFAGSPGTAFKNCNKSKLNFSEINYNADLNFNQGFWFEIINTDTVSVNLDNYYFRKAFDTTIYRFRKNVILAPKQFYAISFDSSKFCDANPFVQNAIFMANPGFNIKGDIIQLFDLNEQWLNLRYKDTLPFPLAANGAGYTLEMINDSLNPFEASSFATRCYGGSPGTSSILPCNPALTSDIHITEINYLSDANSNSGFWFELENQSTTALPLLNWHLAGFDLKRSYPINKNIMVPAKGYWVFATDSVKFKQQFPLVTNVAFIPPLLFTTTGDSIKLVDYRGFLACKAFFSNDSLWSQGPNGLGYTLEKRNTVKNPITPLDWQSGCLKGSPGKAFTPCTKPTLIISEINYKSNKTMNSGQWFELKNTTSNALNLSSYTFKFNATDSLKIGYTLPANDYITIVNDSNLFKQQHPFSRNFKWISFKLDTIKNAMKIYDNTVLMNSAYYTIQNATWPLANGGGYTLELIHDTLNEADTQSWTTGCLNGSPGTPMLFPCNPALTSDLSFSEINYLSDTFNNSGQWVELFNRSNQPISLQNWVVQNSSLNYFVFTEPFSIAAKSYMVLSNDTSAFHAIYPAVQQVHYLNLKLSVISDSISLRDYAQTTACKAFYSNAANWYQGANGNGRTLESLTESKNNSTVVDWKEGCIQGSPGKAQSNCVDRVLISELNYAPQNSTNDGQWIELFITSNNTTNISKFSFRSNNTLNSFVATKPTLSNTYLVLSADTAAFNNYHSYIANKEQFSALSLSNGTYPLVIYDQNNRILQSIQYSSIPPWDTLANGKGYTLELMKDSTNFSRSNNWKSYCKRGSPGGATVSPCGNAFGVPIRNVLTTPLIYPNPAGNVLTIIRDHQKVEKEEYRIYDLLGRTLGSGSLIHSTTNIDISHFLPGIYFIQIENIQALKFVKE